MHAKVQNIYDISLVFSQIPKNEEWNKFDEKLSQSEVYNKRVLKEMLKGKNQTHYDHLRKQAIFNLFSTLFIPTVVIPLLHMKGIFHDTSFYLLEAVCVLGLLMVICRLILLSRFNVLNSIQDQLRALVNYKRGYIYEMGFGMPLAVIGISLTLYFENATSPIGLFFVALGVIAGASCGWIGWTKHKQTMQSIESNLTELKEFEA